MRANSFDTQGPTFVLEPPSRLEFINTLGGRADCSARGNPATSVEWLDQDGNPATSIPKVNIEKIRQISKKVLQVLLNHIYFACIVADRKMNHHPLGAPIA